MNARMTGFTVESNGDVYLMVGLGAGAHRVLLSRAMLAGIAEASTEMVLSGVFPEKPAQSKPERTYYCQVESGNRSLTYRSNRYIPVGSTVTLPPLPWMHHEWKAVTISDEHEEGYHGEVKPILAMTI
jgi:hypothetical protein